MKKITLILAAILVALNINALPEWQRKYATSVIRGHVINLPEGKEYLLRLRGAASSPNLKGDIVPHMESSQIGYFTLSYKHCWPKQTNIDFCSEPKDFSLSLNFMLCPGDTIDVEIDYQKAQDLKNDKERQFREAVRVSGETFPQSDKALALQKKLRNQAATIDKQYMQEHCRVDFTAYREWEWSKHLARLKEIKSSKLKKHEKQYLQLLSEEDYLSRLYSFDFLMEYIGCDSTELVSAKAQFSEKDPHASALAFPSSINSAYCFGTGYLDYLRANDLDELPMGHYLKERKKAEDMAAQVKVFRQVSSEEIDQLSPEFQQPIIELKAKIAEKLAQSTSDWKPSGEPATWLDQIVQRHKGKVVYIDFWATWCGPCNKGIQEMETVKSDYEKRGVDFVYITNNSSSTDGFLALKQKHSGDHFLFSSKEWAQMNIPDYSGSIPHYLIYGRDGRLLKTLSGWGGLERVTQELDNALAQ